MREFVRRNLQWMLGPRSLSRTWPAMAVLGPLAFNVPVESFVAQIHAILAMEDTLREELAAVTAPTLVLCGAHDPVTPVKRHTFMAELIPYAKLVVLENAGHFPTLETPAEATQALRDWMHQPLVLQ